MKFTKDEIRKAMLLYAVTDQMWLKEGEKLADVVESVLRNGATFLQIREKDLAEDAFEAAKTILRLKEKKSDREIGELSGAELAAYIDKMRKAKK